MEKFNSITWGDFGVGKTPFCGTLEQYEKTSPCLFLDVDQGTMSLDGLKPRPSVIMIEKWDDVGRVYKLLETRKWEELSKLTGDAVKEYRSVVIDSGTELAGILLRAIVAEDDRNDGVPDQASYFKTEIRFFNMYRAFQKLPMSVVMTAGVKDQKDDVSGVVRLFPEFSPGLLHKLLRFTDLILFMGVSIEKDKEVRYIQTHPSNRFTARDRSGKLDPVIKGERLYWKQILDKVLV